MCLPICVVICSSMCLSYFTYPSNLCLSTHLYYTILYYTILYCTILYYSILYYTLLYYTIRYDTILYYTIYLSVYLSTYLSMYLSLFPVFYLELIELLQRALQILFRYSLLAHTKQFISLKSFYPDGTDEQVPFPCFGRISHQLLPGHQGPLNEALLREDLPSFRQSPVPMDDTKKYDKTKMVANPNSSGHVNINKEMWMQLLKNEVEISLTFT